MDKYILLDHNSLSYAFKAAPKGSNDLGGLRAISEYASQNGFKFVVTDVVLQEIRQGPQQAEILHWLASNAEVRTTRQFVLYDASIVAGEPKTSRVNLGELANLEFASTQMNGGSAVTIWSDDKFFDSLQNHKNGLTAPQQRITSSDLLKGARDSGSLSEQDFRSIVSSYRQNVEPFRTQPSGIAKSPRLDTFDTPSTGTGNVLADRGALSRALATGEVTPRGAAAFLQSAGLSRVAADFLALTKNGAPILVAGIAAYALYKIVNDVAEARGVSPSAVLAEAAAGLSYDDLRSAAAGVITEGLIQSALGPIGVARQLYSLALAGEDIIGALELLELAHPNDSVIRSLGDLARAFKETAAYQQFKDNKDALQRAVSDWLAGDGERYKDDYSLAVNRRVATDAALDAISGNLTISSRTLAGFEFAADGTRLDKAWVQLANGTRILEYADGGEVVRRDYWAGGQKVLSEYKSDDTSILNYFDRAGRVAYAATIADGSDVASVSVDQFGRTHIDVPSVAALQAAWTAIDAGPHSLFMNTESFSEADFSAAFADPRLEGIERSHVDGFSLSVDASGHVDWVQAEVKGLSYSAPDEVVTIEREIVQDPFAGALSDPSAYAYRETVTAADGTMLARTERTASGTTVTRARDAETGQWNTTVRTAEWQLAGGQIGAALGSAIGNAIGGRNVFARVAASTVLGATLGTVGEGFGAFIANSSDQASLGDEIVGAFGENFGARLATSFQSAAVGAVVSGRVDAVDRRAAGRDLCAGGGAARGERRAEPDRGCPTAVLSGRGLAQRTTYRNLPLAMASRRRKVVVASPWFNTQEVSDAHRSRSDRSHRRGGSRAGVVVGEAGVVRRRVCRQGLQGQLIGPWSCRVRKGSRLRPFFIGRDGSRGGRQKRGA
ncbi:MAG: hypothetical protein ACOYLQ_12650 [Hyphomicrobiaceae bacterium]